MSPIIKRKPEKQKMPSKYVLLIYTFISLMLMALTFTGVFPDAFIRNTFGYFVVPFEKGISHISMFLTDQKAKTTTIQELLAENEELKKQIDELSAENTMLAQDKYELTNLRELYELDQDYSDYDKIGARVISWNANNWFSSFLIDKGSDDGLEMDMNVIADGGLVGRISQVGPNWSRVTSIIEDNSNVSSYVLHTQDNIMVYGGLEMIDIGYIGYSQLHDSDGQVQIGDKVVTSYISDKYLPGILIGYIATIDIDSNHITKSGYITPVVDFSHLSEVLIITKVKDNVEFPEEQ